MALSYSTIHDMARKALSFLDTEILFFFIEYMSFHFTRCGYLQKSKKPKISGLYFVSFNSSILTIAFGSDVPFYQRKPYDHQKTEILANFERVCSKSKFWINILWQIVNWTQCPFICFGFFCYLMMNGWLFNNDTIQGGFWPQIKNRF